MISQNSTSAISTSSKFYVVNEISVGPLIARLTEYPSNDAIHLPHPGGIMQPANRKKAWLLRAGDRWR